MTEPNWITAELLHDVVAQAQASPRKRKNFNFHPTEDAMCHRLVNAMEPDSYIAPHRHLDPNKDETILLLRGRMGVVFFDESGEVTGDAVLDLAGARLGVTIPVGVFHSLVAFDPGTIFFESKAGPYRALSDGEKAPWAPREGDAAAVEYLSRLRSRFVQEPSISPAGC